MTRQARIGAITDDGAMAEGYAHLLTALVDRNWTVDALAPESGRTGLGTAVEVESFAAGAARPRDRLPFLNGPPDFGIDVYNLTPAAVSRIACERAGQIGSDFPPFCVVVGVNHGPNVGENLIHSGTFGAALVAFWLRHTAIAVSLDDVHSVNEADPGPFRFAEAARVGVAAVDWALDQPQPVLCNINVPNNLLGTNYEIEPTRPNGHTFMPSSVSALRTDIEALRDRHVSVTVFSSGSIEPHAALAGAACRKIAEAG